MSGMVFSIKNRQKIWNDQLGNKRWFSHHHCLFFILVLVSLLFFNYIIKKDMVSEWNPKHWIQNHSSRRFFPSEKLNDPSGTTNGSEAGASSASQTLNISSTPEPRMKNQTTVSVKVVQQKLQVQTARPTPVPYVSPGPYLVEYPSEYHFIINQPRRCEQEKPFVVLMVQVAPRNRAHRDIIRSTWGNESLVLDQVVKLFFLLGMQTGEDSQQVHQQLLQESNEHRDLIQSDFVDCYKNLTIKTMVMMEWLSEFCSNASYAMKVDSDIFLNVPNMVQWLLKAPRTNYITGLVVHDTEVYRDPESKWYVPEEILPDSIYPPYPYGLGYMLSLDLTKKLIEASRHIRALYVEDAYLGLCLNRLGILPTDPPDQAAFNADPLDFSPCALSKVIAITTEPSSDRVQLWKDLKAQTQPC